MQFYQKFTPGEVLALALHLGVFLLDFTQMVLVVSKHLEMAIAIILINPEQPLLIELFQKITTLGSPCSCPTPWCLWG